MNYGADSKNVNLLSLKLLDFVCSKFVLILSQEQYRPDRVASTFMYPSHDGILQGNLWLFGL